MNRINWTWVSLLTLFLTACSQDELLNDFGPKRNEVEISARILPRLSHRAAINTDGKGTFTDGDEIQLFVTPDHSSSPNQDWSLTQSNGNWTPQLTWDNDLYYAGDQPTFSAFYPVLPYNRKIEVSFDQHLSNNLQKADLLCAVTKAKRGERVVLDFKHLMSRLSVKLLSNHYSESELSKAVVKVWAATKGTIDPATGKIKYTYNNNSLSREIRLAYVGNGEFQAILIPQEILWEWNEKCWVKLAIGGTEKEIKAPARLNDGSPFNALEPGKEVTLNVSLDKEDSNLWVNQTKWVYGVNNPPFDDTSKWGYAFAQGDFTILGLPWDRSYGWFDCNKTNPVNPDDPAHDSNMCWAASCSNLIHWWLSQNADYVQRFGYTGPSQYPNSTSSEVFQLFKDNFENEGYQVTNGLNWFFIGRDGINYKPNGGFFKKVFGDNSVINAVQFAGNDKLNRKRFNDAFKQAFRNKEAIQISFILPSGSAHAITAWGADFDEKGEVKNLYITENNDIDWELQPEKVDPDYDRKLVPAGLFRKPVQFRETVLNRKGQVDPEKCQMYYMESGVKDAYTMMIYQLVFLNLHRDKWEEYFRNNP